MLVLCSRNARPEKGLVRRPHLDQHGCPSKREKQANLEGPLIERKMCSFDARSKGQPEPQPSSCWRTFFILLGDGIKATLLHQVQQLEGSARRPLLADLPLLHRRNARVQEAGKCRLADP
jgi:hypothetical protein